MDWNCEELQRALTAWIVSELERRKIPHAVFSHEAGLQKTADGSTFRKLKSGLRRWSFSDVCKVASYFEESPSDVLRKAEDPMGKKKGH